MVHTGAKLTLGSGTDPGAVWVPSMEGRKSEVRCESGAVPQL